MSKKNETGEPSKKASKKKDEKQTPLEDLVEDAYKSVLEEEIDESSLSPVIDDEVPTIDVKSKKTVNKKEG